MGITQTSNLPINLRYGKGISTKSVSISNPSYTRPTDWLAITDPTSMEQKLVGLVAVYDNSSNYIALATTITDATQYTVDWGDGTSENVNSGVTAQHNYSWSSISSGTLTSNGYRQAIITITPTTAGKTFSAINLDRRHSAVISGATSTINPWLDISVSAPNATILILGGTNTNANTSTYHTLIEKINIISHNTINMTYLCINMYNLRSISISNTASVTNMSSMFQHCRSLQTVPLFNTAAVTNMSSMFYNCSSLQTVPLFNTASVINMNSMLYGCFSLKTVPLFNTAVVTNMVSMFQSCCSLQTAPLFNTASVTNMSNMFYNCYNLQTVPLFNTAAVTSMTNMFYNCYGLQTVPLFNTAAVNNMSSMFYTCISLKTVPLFNTVAVTDMNNMFINCYALQTVPLFNTALVTNMSNMLYGCSSLQTVPLFNTAAVTNISSMFYNCYGLQTVPLFNTASVTNMSNMFGACYGLQTVPLFNTAAVINMTNMFQNCYSLEEIPALNMKKISTVANNNLFVYPNISKANLDGQRWTQNFTQTKMGATELNSMYTALATLNPTVTNVSANGITVTYTVSDIAAFVAGRTVTMTSIDPIAYNISGTVVAVTGTSGSGTFTVTNTAIGTYVSGGIATITDNKTITVSSTPGAATDDPTIATNKGWTVTG